MKSQRIVCFLSVRDQLWTLVLYSAASAVDGGTNYGEWIGTSVTISVGIQPLS